MRFTRFGTILAVLPLSTPQFVLIKSTTRISLRTAALANVSASAAPPLAIRWLNQRDVMLLLYNLVGGCDLDHSPRRLPDPLSRQLELPATAISIRFDSPP